MKKNYKLSVMLALFLSLAFFKSKAQCNALTYSQTPSSFGCSFDYISNVSFSTINRSSFCDTYTMVSTPNPTLTQGLSYILSVTTGGDVEGVRAWIDYNIDGTFTNTSPELVLGPSFANTNPATYTVLVTIPFTSSLGATRLRTRCRYAGAPTDATSPESYGETEDYCITIAAGSGCSGTPNAGTAVISSTAGCPSLNFNLSATGLSTGSGLAFQWQSSSALTGPFTSIASATSNALATSATVTTFYRLVTTCTTSALSNTSSVVSYSIVNPGPCICNVYGASSANFAGDEDIYRVNLGSLNNISNCTTPATGPNSILNRYANYTGVLAAPNLCRGTSNGYTVVVGSCSTYWYGAATAIFIDFNQNGSFADPGEQVMSNNSFSTGASSPLTYTYTGSIVIPATASLGVTRMRVICVEQTGSVTIATGTYAYGETEDYCINIAGSSPVTAVGGSVCPGQPFVITPSGSNTYTYVSPTGSLTGSSVTVSPIATTNYTINSTNALGCVSTGTDIPVITVASLAAPQLTASSTPTAYCIGGSAVLNVSGASTYTWTSPASNATSLSVSPSVTTVYTVSGTGTNVCNGVVAVTVVVNQIPTVTVNSGTICSLYNFTLNPSGASTYTINSASGTLTSNVVNPLANANYTVTGTSANGCLSTASLAPISTVVVIPSPTISATSGSVCLGLSFSLSPSGSNGTYSVNGVSLGTNVIGAFSPNANTTYTVVGTNTNGCVSFTPALASVSVVALPTITAISSASAICLNQATANLSASGANTYTWSNSLTGSNVAVSPSVSSIYTVTGTSTLLCDNTSTVAVTVLQLPIVSASSSQNFICVGGNASLTAVGATTYSWSNGTSSAVAVVNPSVNASYVVTGTDLNGCRNTATVAITVNTIVINVLPTSTTVCLGNSATFTASGATSYTWNGTNYFPTYVVTPTTSTTYTVMAIDANLCPQMRTVLASVYQLPNVTASITKTLICLNESAVLTAGGANTYSWSNGNTTSSFTVSPTIDITYYYTVVGTDTNNCIATASQSLTVSKCTGFEKTVSEATQISVYPNPSAGSFHVDLNGMSVKSIQVLDLTGRMIMNQTVNSDKVDLNLNHYANGIYYLKILGTSNTQTIKLVKE